MTNFLYNPDRKSKSQLIAEFVVRTDVFEEIMHDLETSPMKTPEQHYLLVGQRGSGKTTLLNRIKYAVEDSAALNEWLIPVIFSEEQYNMSELGNLWENIGQVLEDYYEFDGVAVEMDKHSASAHFEEKAYDLLENELQKRGKKLLLLIDNIGDFLKKLDDKEVRRLREILQTRPYLRMIAGSPFYLESLLDYKQPFFEFFKVLRLDGLSQAETEHLLRKLGEVYGEEEKINAIIEKTPERIETLRVLTGGVPRTIALMFRIFIDHKHSNSINDLERVLDAVTPLYKHRMDDLPTQQQKIVDVVAKYWDPITVKELKGRVRMESKQVSAQLRQLEKDQVIEKRESGTKNHYYLLKERFFNIWYLMRYGRKQDRRRALWLVRFLESWCSHADMERRVEAFVEDIKDQKINEDQIEFFADVYSLIDLTLKSKATLKQSGSAVVSSKVNLNDAELLELAQEAVTNNNFYEALDWFSQIPVLECWHKKIITDFAYKLDDENRNDCLIKWLQNPMLSSSQLQIGVLFILINGQRIIYKISKIKANRKEEVILAVLKASLMLFVSLSKDAEKSGQPVDFSQELSILAISLAPIYQLSLLHSAIDLFENSEDPEFMKAILEPIYFALLILAGKKDYSQLPAEKLELIRNIADQITQK